MDIKTAIAKVAERQDLTTDEMKAVMRIIMQGEATDAQIGGFLVGLRMKGETIDEITGAVEVMRELVTGVNINASPVVDIVGTGGDGANLFNVSTAATFVIAGAGGHVAKHGNRSVSSRSGSSDLLDQAGLRLEMTPEQITRCVNETGVGFMFAPNHHKAMKHAVGPRKELGMRTIFNILGPMTNPAGVKHQLIGVFNGDLCAPMAEVLRRLGSEHILVVHSDDGLDEISLASHTRVAELRNGEVTEYRIRPEDMGIKSQAITDLQVADATESLELIRAALGPNPEGRAALARDMIALNAGAALYAADLADTLEAGASKALDAMASGAALERMDRLATLSQTMEQQA
ncbi:anthranilate phosphoribosyltransferase [Halospina denitrificans]|uniref:Anthranilate phosphoribosyltransferase n=1 Tax=Halospina denitrificans TaxID=332522 RepID=A0A4R7JTQ7_9GAMM|nr:anthranilate phosphoribosyltransferase [Halospina denitrificans]TDT40279.1 anthranilate phosphoribosyltransferase [Halospina denitrificans]